MTTLDDIRESLYSHVGSFAIRMAHLRRVPQYTARDPYRARNYEVDALYRRLRFAGEELEREVPKLLP